MWPFGSIRWPRHHAYLSMYVTIGLPAGAVGPLGGADNRWGREAAGDRLSGDDH
jgi:hypothetical protein